MHAVRQDRFQAIRLKALLSRVRMKIRDTPIRTEFPVRTKPPIQKKFPVQKGLPIQKELLIREKFICSIVGVSGKL